MLQRSSLADLGSPSEQFVIALREASESDNRESRKTAGAALELLKKEGPLQATAEAAVEADL